ncbi:prepilin peptidase [Gemmatimonadota bacterium]
MRSTMMDPGKRNRGRRWASRVALTVVSVAAVCALSAAAVARWGFTTSALTSAVFSAAMVALAAINLDRGILPNAITLPGLAVGIALAFLDPRVAWYDSIVGAVLGTVLLYSIARLYRMLHPRHEEGMGMGNVKLMAMVGAFLGWQGMLLTILFGSVLGSVLGLMMPQARRRSLPFGTFLALAAVVTDWFGSPFLDWYVGFLK